MREHRRESPGRAPRAKECDCCNSPTLRRAWPRDGPEAAICVQGVDVQCVLQFTLIHAASCALHRRTSRVIHRSKLFLICFVFQRFQVKSKRLRSEKAMRRLGRGLRGRSQSRRLFEPRRVELSPRHPAGEGRGTRRRCPKKTEVGRSAQRSRARIRGPTLETCRPGESRTRDYKPSPWVAPRTNRYPETRERTWPERARRFMRSTGPPPGRETIRRHTV